MAPEPRVGVMAPARILRRVVLPEPFGPSSARMCPASSCGLVALSAAVRRRTRHSAAVASGGRRLAWQTGEEVVFTLALLGWRLDADEVLDPGVLLQTLVGDLQIEEVPRYLGAMRREGRLFEPHELPD